MLGAQAWRWFAAAAVMSAVSTSGTWVGDSWVPPHGEILAISQIQRLHGDRDTLVIGDSLARRFTSTLAIVLQARGGEDVLNAAVDDQAALAKGSHRSYSHAIPKLGGNGTRLLDFQWAPLARDVTKFVTALHEQPLPKYSLLIVCIGIHDAEERSRSVEEFLRDTQATIAALAAVWGGHHDPTVVWRTTPYRDGGAQSEINQRVEQLNANVLHNHPAAVHVSNAAKQINPKSQGTERESGDSPEHFNNIIRWVEIQCISHTLKHLDPDHTHHQPWPKRIDA